MTDRIVLDVIRHIESARLTTSYEETARSLKSIGVSGNVIDEALRVLHEKAENIERWRDPATLSSHERPTWYSGPAESDRFWPPVKRAFLKAWSSEDNVAILDRDSSRVVSELHNPHLSGFSTRGLVAGDVQSGKTSNFTAVIAKAADTGFRMFVVLSGTKNKLRRQTQLRLEKDLVAHDQGVWMLLTGPGQAQDFPASPPNVNSVLSMESIQRILIVAKKNSRVLRRIVRWLDGAQQGVLAHTPTLLIDDEADEASINVAAAEDERSQVNDQIVRILSRLPRVSFVGYTATPYANFFIDKQVPEDLYPRHFIVNLPTSPGYFGYETIFGRERTRYEDEDADIDGLDVIRQVRAQEALRLRPGTRQVQAFSVKVETDAPALRDALHYFLMATAARFVRGQSDRHSTMLIHTSQRTSVHVRTVESIKEYLTRLSGRLSADDKALIDELGSLWDEEVHRVPAAGFQRRPIGIQEVLASLPDVMSRTQVVSENYLTAPEARLSYEGNPGVFIVVGGDVLSRGLTLEGLVTSYFTRTASAYDTLMQMGRWFGYRHGYEDLPRVWMTGELRSDFYDLAGIDREMRQLIERQYSGTVTPLDYAPLIRSHPRMMITSRLKMGKAVRRQVSFSETHLQTIHLWRREEEKTKLAANIECTARLVGRAVDECCIVSDLRPAQHRVVIERVSGDAIMELIGSFEWHPAQADLSREPLLKYIRHEMGASSPSLRNWNVAVICGTGTSETERIDLGPLAQVSCIRRSRLDISGIDANIKALMSMVDVLADTRLSPRDEDDWLTLKRRRAEVYPDTGLLLIYPIDRVSPPRPSSKEKKSRVPMDAALTVIGLAMVFPRSRRLVNSEDYVTQDRESEILELPDEELYEIEEEDAARTRGSQG